jgi:hypothetical protein
MPGWRVLIAMVTAMTIEHSAAAEDVLAGPNLYRDVARYASFGLHRFGSPGDRATTDWIAGELQAAGFSVEFQPVVLGKQYVLEHATAGVDGTTVEATPFWWPPPDKSSFHLTAPLVRDGDAAGKILWFDLPFDRGAYLGPAHRAVIAQAAARGPAAILLTIGNPAEDRFAYNVTQEDEPWPVPVIVVAGKARGVFERAVVSGAAVTFDVGGHVETNVAGRNVVARFGEGSGPAIVVSTPRAGTAASASAGPALPISSRWHALSPRRSGGETSSSLRPSVTRSAMAGWSCSSSMVRRRRVTRSPGCISARRTHVTPSPRPRRGVSVPIGPTANVRWC